jgi:16S rRNA (guanine(966)-N(2))-methyltransferase RsmD
MNYFKIVSGVLKGKHIFVPESKRYDQVRPLTKKETDSIFLIAQSNSGSLKSLDLFSGSGLFNFDIYSSGIKKIHAIDINKYAIKITHKNITSLHLMNKIYISVKNSVKMLRHMCKYQHSYNILLIDPPYDIKFRHSFWKSIIYILDKSSIIIYRDKEKQKEKDVIDEFPHVKKDILFFNL